MVKVPISVKVTERSLWMLWCVQEIMKQRPLFPPASPLLRLLHRSRLMWERCRKSINHLILQLEKAMGVSDMCFYFVFFYVVILVEWVGFKKKWFELFRFKVNPRGTMVGRWNIRWNVALLNPPMVKWSHPLMSPGRILFISKHMPYMSNWQFIDSIHPSVTELSFLHDGGERWDGGGSPSQRGKHGGECKCLGLCANPCGLNYSEGWEMWSSPPCVA